jgi:TIR domain/NACHT domain
MARVFLSYVHQEPDQSLARELAETLRRWHDVFIDTMIAAGQVWGDVIEQNLRTADFLIALISTKSAASPMVEAEIATAHQLHVAASRPAIVPVRLDSATLKYPLTAYVGRFQQMTWNGPDDTPVLTEGVIRALGQRAAAFVPSTERQQMIQRVRADWIDGILDKSLYRAARIELGLQPQPRAIEHRVDAVIQRPDEDPIPLDAGTRLLSVFDDHLGQLLVLGAPGSGKTTLLLELASELLDRAEADSRHPIPVIFNLSSWAERRQPIGQWLVQELRMRSDVPRQLAQKWVADEQLLLLLDGLDEVAAAYRDDCVEAINSYRSEHGFVKIVVCSRVSEYQALTHKLRLPAAIAILPLSRSEVLRYFDNAGTAIDSVRAAAEADHSLFDLLETPLMLSVAALVAGDLTPGSGGPGLPPEARRSQLFAFYVDAMFKRRTKETHYPPDRMRGWLTWFAKALVRREQTLFRIEDLRHSWLDSRIERLLVSVAIAVVVAVASALVGAISLDELIDHTSQQWFYLLRYFAPIGLVMAIVRGRSRGPIDLVEVRWPGFLSLLTAMAEGGALGGALGFVFGFVLCNDSGAGWDGSEVGAIAFGLGAAMNHLAAARVLEIRPSADFALLQSLRNTIAYVSVSMGFGIAAIVMESTLWKDSDNVPLGYAVVGMGMLGWVGFFFGMEKGGYFLLDHYATRLLLWSRGRLPWNILGCLDAAVARVLMRRVGAAYIFVHRILLDHFASTAANASGNAEGSADAAAGK